MDFLSSISYALFGGLMPARFWLWLFLREDRAHPEPRSLIALSFIGGMAAVICVIPIERFSMHFFDGTALIIIWAAIEEILKVTAAYLTVMWRRSVDEPIDALIYMISAALGFTALENALFILGPVLSNDLLAGALTGDLRFLGASLLHVLSSSLVGAAIALSFYMGSTKRHWYLLTGLIAATALHATFNFFIIGDGSDVSTDIFRVFYAVWIGIILLFLFFEKAKRITRINQ
jgi:RsiW-degrading membrane proteinase PrsW (M82 family)